MSTDLRIVKPLHMFVIAFALLLSGLLVLERHAAPSDLTAQEAAARAESTDTEATGIDSISSQLARTRAHPGAFAPGDSYDFEIRSSALISVTPRVDETAETPASMADHSSVSAEGTLALHLVVHSKDSNKDEYAIVATPTTVELRQSKTRAPIDSSVALAPFAFWIDGAGSITGWAFPSTEDPRVCDFQKAHVTGALQFLTPRDATLPISIRQADETGWHQARFELRAPRLLDLACAEVVGRSKSAYENRERAASMDGTLDARGEGEAAFDEAWILASRSIETREIELGFARAKVDTEFTATRGAIGRESIDPAVLAAFVPSRTPAFDPHSSASLVSRGSDDPMPGDLEALLAELMNHGAAGRIDSEEAFKAWSRLARLLSLHPELLAGIEDRILQGEFGLGRDLIVTAIGCAGGAGCTQAIATLADLLSHSGEDDSLRTAVLMSSHQIGSGAAPLVSALEQMLADPTLDPSVHGAAMLVLGTLLGGAAEHSGELESLLAELIHAKAWAASVGHTDLYLAALGNSGVPALMAQAFEYLDDANAAVRLAACEVLAKLPGQASIAALVDAATHDVDEVRIAAMAALASHAPDTSAAGCLAHVALSDPNALARMSAVLALKSFMELSEALTALNAVAAMDADAALQHLAQEILASQ